MENESENDRNMFRRRYYALRASINPQKRQIMNECILVKLLSLTQDLECKLLLSYVSTEFEVDTKNLINLVLCAGIDVAVPKCKDSLNEIEFYRINSISELVKGRYGLLEPQGEPAKKVTYYKNSLCIVPGICFDRHGNRMGYGKGFYDRFLTNFSGVSVGICYSVQLSDDDLPIVPLDVPLNIIFTEKETIDLRKRPGFTI